MRNKKQYICSSSKKKITKMIGRIRRSFWELDKRSLKRFYIKQDVVQEKRGREIGSMLGSDLGGHESVRS
ncbi:MAG: hypothetical protein LBT83_08005, partial [Tannerella sp.]|nr:hypothetical protein [Tannerella sp.]